MVFRDVQSDGTVRLTGEVYSTPEEPDPPYESTFTFAIPSALWTIVHGEDRYLSIDTYDNNGDPVVGDVRYPDRNTITVTFYSPMSGYANLYD